MGVAVGAGVGVGVTAGGVGLTHVAVVWSDSAPERAVIVSLPAEVAVEHSGATPPAPVVTESVAGCAPVTAKSTRMPASGLPAASVSAASVQWRAPVVHVASRGDSASVLALAIGASDRPPG